MTNIEADGVSYEICWHGATWRDFPQPQVAVTPCYEEDLRAYLRAHAAVWYRPSYLAKVKAIRAGQTDGIYAALHELWLWGEVERQRCPDGRWRYRWSARQSEAA